MRQLLDGLAALLILLATAVVLCGFGFLLWIIVARAPLGTLGGREAGATAINAQGQVICDSMTVNGEQYAFLWSNGMMIGLGTLGGTYSVAAAISAGGQVVGYSTTATGEAHATLWVSSGN